MTKSARSAVTGPAKRASVPGKAAQTGSRSQEGGSMAAKRRLLDEMLQDIRTGVDTLASNAKTLRGRFS
jgi:hypothetical protein